MRLMGYTDRLSVKPGEGIQFKISAELAPYDVEFVRLRGVGKDNGDVIEELIPSAIAGTFDGRSQELRPGSYAVATASASCTTLGFDIWVRPTLADRDRQVIMSVSDANGSPVLVLAMLRGAFELTLRGTVVRAAFETVENKWVRIRGGDLDGKVHLAYQIDGRWPSLRGAGSGSEPAGDLTRTALGTVLVAAETGPRAFFNGRVANPRLLDRFPTEQATGTVIADWDFSADIETRRITDVSGNGWDGDLVNRPGRALRSQNWDGRLLRYQDDPRQWAAIHFHEDDLNDAGWETDFTLAVDPELPSGIYAAKLSQGGQVVYVPFYVQPTASTANKVAFVAPTNTYLAYANEHLGYGERGEAHQKRMRDPIQLNDIDHYIHTHPELGLSIYDKHADGSGVMYSSWKRPVLNFSPNYITWLSASRRHFAADFYITGWLEQLGVGYDVITDEDVHRGGTDLVGRYDVLITGSHPEYPTSRQMTTFYDFVDGGGSLMYLGGNGFYWVTSFDGDDTMTLECRRGFAGERNWTSHPSELHHSSTGEVGGTYTHRGQSSREFVGITSAGVGWGTASGYQRSEDSYSPELAFLFEGIAETTLGDFGHSLGGAAGDELDSADFENGTPPNARILMSSRHNECYYPFLETVTQVEPDVDGTNNPNVRSDVVYIDTGSGKIFSAGSICWAGSLAWNGYDNNIAKLCENALKGFAR